MHRRIIHLALLTAILATPVLAQESTDELAKKLSNPLSNLISVPLQFNVDFGYGDDDGTRTLLNVQPVIPASINENWNLITRVVMPIVYQDDVVPGSDQFGLGDTTPTFFFSPKAPGPSGVLWGFGPVLHLPTATDDLLGTEKWGLGPSLVIVKQEGSYTYGLLVNHIESVAGADDRADLSSTFLQPILSKGFPGGRTLGFNLEATYDWEGEQWTVPLNVTYSKVTKIGSRTVSLIGGLRAYLDEPEGGPDWGVRFGITLVFPKG